MTTELQKQVNLLKSRNIQHQSLQDGRPSIFLTAREAAAVDVSTVYEAAIIGLEALIQYDSRFEKYLTGLLHPSSTSVQRELKTREENEELDREIEKLLNLLSLWAFEPNAHLILEYLIRRYLIHEYNTDALLQCLLVSHDTKVFGRILQLCRIAETRWIFLNSFKESGVPVPRNILVKKIVKSAWLAEVICTIALSALNLVGIRKATSSTINNLIIDGAEKVLSFATAVIVETAEQVAFDDTKIRSIYIFLLEGLKISNNPVFTTEQSKVLLDWKCSCCLIISQLSRKTPFAPSLQRVLANAFGECINKSSLFSGDSEDVLLQSAFTTISILSDRGSLDLTPKIVKELVNLERKVNDEETAFIEYLSITADSSFPSRLFSRLVEYLLEVEDADESSLEIREKKLPPEDLQLLITTLSKEELLSKEILSYNLQLLLIAGTRNDTFPESTSAAIKSSIRVISDRHPRIFDEIVTSLYQASNQVTLTDSNDSSSHSQSNSSGIDGNFSEKLTIFLSDLLNNYSYTTAMLFSPENLFLALHSPVRQIRIEAVKKLSTLNLETKEDTEETQSLIQAIAVLLEDTDHEVATVVWNKSIIAVLLKFWSHQNLFQVVQSVTNWWFEQKNETTEEIHFTVLYKIFQSLNEDKIYEELFTAERSQWLIQWALSLTVGPIDAIAVSPESKIISKLKKVSFELLQKAGVVSSISVKEKDVRKLVITKIVESLKKKTLDTLFAEVFDLSNVSFGEINYFIRLSLLQLFSELPHSSSKKGEDSILISSLLAVATSLLSDFQEQESPIQKHFIATLSTFFKLFKASGLDSQAKKKHSNSKELTLSSLLKLDAVFNEAMKPKLNFFLQLCLSNDAALLEFLDEALICLFEDSYHHHYLLQLVEIIANPAVFSSSFLSSEEDLQVVLVISFQILILALQSIQSTELTNKNGKAKGKEPKATNLRSPSENLLVAVLLPLLLWGASNPSTQIRQLSIKASELVSQLETAEGDEQLENGYMINWSNYKSFCQLVLQKAKLVQSSPEAVISIFLDSQATVKSNTLKETFITELWKVTSWIYGNRRFYNFTQSLFAILPGFDVTENEIHYVLGMLKRSLQFPSSENCYLILLIKFFKSSFLQVEDLTGQMIYLQFIEEILDLPSSLTSSSLIELKKLLLQFIADGNLNKVDPIYTKKISQLLLQNYLVSSANNYYLDALSALPLDEETVIAELQSSKEQISAFLERLAKTQEDLLIDEQSTVTQKLVFVLEAYSRGLYSPASNNTAAPSKFIILHIFFELLEQTKELTKRWGIILNYLNSLLIESVYSLVASLQSQKLLYTVTPPTTTTAKKGSKSKAIAIAGDTGSHYYHDSETLKKDLTLILNLLVNIPIYQFQSFAFKILNTLLVAEPKHGIYLIDESSRLLSHYQDLSVLKNHLVQILHLRDVYIQQLSLEEKSSESLITLQIITQSLISVDFTDYSVQERQQIVRLLLTLSKQEEEQIVFLSLYNAFICQTVYSYQSSSHTATNKQQPNNQAIDTIALSRAAQRRAKRAVVSSLPEQLYQLCHFLFFQISSQIQINVLTTLISTAQQYFQSVISGYVNSETSNIRSNATITEVFNERFIEKSLQYLQSQIAITEMETENANSQQHQHALAKEYSATIATIYIEFILEILENKKFHRNIVRFIQQNNKNEALPSASSSSSSLSTSTSSSTVRHSIIQQQLLEFADAILQYLVLLENSRNIYGPLQETERISLQLEQERYIVSKYAIADMIFTSCLNCIHGFQSLLDIPSFISIIQELLNHDVLTIRQRAIVILKDRLQEAPIEKAVDLELYHDLFIRMKTITVEYLAASNADHTLTSKESAAVSAVSTQSAAQISLVQSAIMCIDILLQYVGKTTTWKNEILALAEVLEKAIPMIYHQSIQKKKSLTELTPHLLDQKKLLGSIILCEATIFRILGANMLSHLPKIMELLISLYDSELVYWTPISSIKKLKALLEMKSQLLFFRTMILSITIIFTSMANFVHSFIPKIVPLLIKTFSQVKLEKLTVHHHIDQKEKENEYEQSIYVDIEQFLSALLNHVPTRLVIPHLSFVIDQIYPIGVTASNQLVNWIQNIVEKADRTVIVNSLAQWITISTQLLAYREKGYTDVTSQQIDEIEKITSTLVTNISLKLTEKELKAFTLKLLEWKNQTTPSNDEEENSILLTVKKGTAFYTVINELVTKLKTLFNSTMGLLWDDYVENITQVKETISQIIENVSALKEGSSKKRKKLMEIRNKLTVKENDEITAYEKYNTILFSLIQSLADHGNGTFINETRYDNLYPIVLHYVPLREIFETDDHYFQYNSEIITPTLSSLCVSVNKDLLWKPMNYQLLLHTRHGVSIVRKVAILTVGRLFQEVGDEYLHLLPECIQFISELLEDSNSDVVAATRETINIIEDLSGEKLDSYLAH